MTYLVTSDAPVPELGPEVQRLRGLVQALDDIRRGCHPDKAALASCPRIHDWRVFHRPDPSLTGIMFNHPAITVVPESRSVTQTQGYPDSNRRKPDSPVRKPFDSAAGRANQVHLDQGFIHCPRPPDRVRGLFTCGRKGRTRVLGALRARTDIRTHRESFNGVRENHGATLGERCAGECVVTGDGPAMPPFARNPGGAIHSTTDRDQLKFAQ
ncbi:hypothetical protein BB934_25600 [Microvirga ossetica]|uniref:Uncharacterized protein n=1 Tax=Microvirga ossetica TaxID=1882682 RepID=A0A1B2EMG9_9HYPH|nr:hypothetical protein BB934_25600 [Microvirga ossetica]